MVIYKANIDTPHFNQTMLELIKQQYKKFACPTDRTQTTLSNKTLTTQQKISTISQDYLHCPQSQAPNQQTIDLVDSAFEEDTKDTPTYTKALIEAVLTLAPDKTEKLQSHLLKKAKTSKRNALWYIANIFAFDEAPIDHKKTLKILLRKLASKHYFYEGDVVFWLQENQSNIDEKTQKSIAHILRKNAQSKIRSQIRAEETKSARFIAHDLHKISEEIFTKKWYKSIRRQISYTERKIGGHHNGAVGGNGSRLLSSG